MSPEQREMRQLFLAIAVAEHHQMFAPELSPYDISDRLGEIWLEILKHRQDKSFTLDVECILALNKRIATAFHLEPGEFRNTESWPAFIEACGDIQDGHGQFCSWIFSALYWNRLNRFRFSTAWIFVNGLRLQSGFPEYKLPLKNLGAFLDSLSGSGPPLYDGQTFYFEDYSS